MRPFLKKDVAFHFNSSNPLHQGMFCTKFRWNLPSGFVQLTYFDQKSFLKHMVSWPKWIKTLNTTGEQSLWNIHIHLQCSSTHLSKMRTAKCLYRVTNSNAHWNPACKPYRYSLHLYICYRFHITLDVVHSELAKLHNTCIDKQWKSLKPKSGPDLVNPRMG